MNQKIPAKPLEIQSLSQDLHLEMKDPQETRQLLEYLFLDVKVRSPEEVC